MNSISIKRKSVNRLARKIEKSEEVYSCKSDMLLQKIVEAKNKKCEGEEVIEVTEFEPTLDINLYALLKDCRRSVDKKYIILIFDVFETLEPKEISFAFNINTNAVNFLIQNAKKFESYRQSGNFMELIGCAALIKVKKVNGYLNLTVVKEISIKELDYHLLKLDKEEEEEYVALKKKRNFSEEEDEEDDFNLDEEDDEEEGDEVE